MGPSRRAFVQPTLVAYDQTRCLLSKRRLKASRTRGTDNNSPRRRGPLVRRSIIILAGARVASALHQGDWPRH